MLLYEFLDEFGGLRRPVPLDKISPYLRAAAVSTEDQTFYENNGLNTAGLIRAAGGEAMALVANVASESEVEAMVKDVMGKWGRVDILVNNASTAISGNIETLDDEGLLERLKGKTLAYMRCCRAALPYLRKSSRARVICIGGPGG